MRSRADAPFSDGSAEDSRAEPRRVVVVGGGASGTLTAIHLLQRRGPRMRITLVEREANQLGRGVAYRKLLGRHPLNVRAAGMSVHPDDAGHFVRWLEARISDYENVIDEPTKAAFLPRRVYGDYLVDQLHAAQELGRHALEVVGDEVARLEPRGTTTLVCFEDQPPIEADFVVLALGNFAPRSDDGIEADNPWSIGVLGDLAADDDVLFVGAGLTTVDHLLSLDSRAHRGRITVVSRHGRWPEPHASGSAIPIASDRIALHRESPRRLLRFVRALVASQPETPWQSIVDGLRPHVGAIWVGWSLAQRRAFLRHLRPIWEAHRHRLPPASMRVIERTRDAGRLELLAGTLAASRPFDARTIEASLALRDGTSRTIRVRRIVRCTGPTGDYAAIDDPLVRQLVASGQLVPDPLRLGVRTDAVGRLVRADGTVASSLFTLGPPRRGALWESTAIGEIREQASAIAGLIASSGRVRRRVGEGRPVDVAPVEDGARTKRE